MTKQKGGGGSLPPDEQPTAPETEPPPAPVGSVQDFRSDMLDRIMEAKVPKGAEALKHTGEIIRRREVTFDVDGADCAEGAFVDQEGNYLVFNITLRSLSSAQELECLRQVQKGPEAPFIMARMALYKVNGRELDEARRGFVWEALGMGGRQVVLGAFQVLGAASEAALGKYLSTRRES